MAEKSFYEDKIKPNLKKIEEYRSKGLSNNKIAELLGVSKTAFYKYINKGGELGDSVKKGDERFALSVESAAFRLACGYDIKYKEREFEYVKGKKVLKKVVEKVKHVLPNPVIQIFMLKNLMPEKYKDNPENKKEEKPVIWNEEKTYITEEEEKEYRLRRAKSIKDSKNEDL